MYYCVIKNERVRTEKMNWAVRLRQTNELVCRTRYKSRAEAAQAIVNTAYQDLARIGVQFPWVKYNI